MKKLRILLSCIDRKERLYYPVWESKLKKKARLYDLYRLILDNPGAEEAELCQAYSGDSSSAYYRAKARLLDMVADLLFVQEALNNNKSGYERQYWNAHRNLLLGRKFMQQNMYEPACEFLSAAREIRMTERVYPVVLEAMGLLRSLLANQGISQDTFLEIDTEIKQYMATLKREYTLCGRVDALKFYSDAKLLQYSPGTEEQEAEEFLSTPLLAHHTFFLETAFWMYRGDYPRAIEVCAQAIEQLEKLDTSVSHRYIRTFKLQQASCYLQLNMEEKLQKALAWLSNERLSERDLLAFQELKCKWFLRGGDYKSAWKIVQKAFRQTTLAKMPKEQQMTWLLLKGYTYFLLLNGSGDRIRPQLDISNLLKQLFVLCKNNKVQHSAAIILQILFYLRSGEKDLLVDMIEALDKYIVRYLSAGENLRTRTYMRMLLLLPKNNFCVKTCKRKAANYLKRLEEAPPNRKQPFSEAEIVPYEMLWDIALMLSDKKKQRLTHRVHYAQAQVV